MFLTISLAIVDTRSSSFDAAQQGEIITGQAGRQAVRCLLHLWAALLSAVALRALYFTHFKLVYFPNIIGLVKLIVQFVIRTEPKASE